HYLIVHESAVAAFASTRVCHTKTRVLANAATADSCTLISRVEAGVELIGPLRLMGPIGIRNSHAICDHHHEIESPPPNSLAAGPLHPARSRWLYQSAGATHEIVQCQ